MRPFGATLSRAITFAGFTQRGFAEAVGTSKGHVGNVASGKRPPSLDQLERWALALRLEGESLDEFLRQGRDAVAWFQTRAAPGLQDRDQRIADLERRLAARDNRMREIASLLRQISEHLPQTLGRKVLRTAGSIESSLNEE